MNVSLQILSDFVTYTKYARYLPKNKRRETYEEIVTRNMEMHIKKFPILEEEIRRNFDYVYNKKVLPSMRSFQFAGKAIELNPVRSYNCSARAIDSTSAFSEAMFILLAGCGYGFSVQKHHVKKLPPLLGPITKGRKQRYLIADSIEGWASAVNTLCLNYFSGTQEIVFDFGDIRPKGTPLKTSGGKAPGPQPLKDCIHNIRKILDSAITDRGRGAQLRPIEAHDIICVIADAVLAGGIRRAACISFFSFDDEDMLVSKYNGWSERFPYRARANNSALLLRHRIKKDEFYEYFDKMWASGTGEPGFIWSNDKDTLANPCQPAWAKVLTPEGIREFRDISVGSKIWSSEGWTTVTKKWSTGIKKVYRYETSSSVFYGTKNHKVISNGEKIEVKDAETIECISGEYRENYIVNPQDVMDGLVIGDGSVHKASNNLVHLYIGEKDKDYFTSEISHLIGKHRPGLKETAWEIKTTIEYFELPKTFKRAVPYKFVTNPNKAVGFLRGLYSANGSICGNRITLKASSKALIEDVQLILSSLGIKSYFTANKAQSVKFQNGNYVCKKSYDLNITSDRDKFVKIIGFLQKYKLEKIQEMRKVNRSSDYDIKSVKLIREEAVFDITVDNNSHTYWTQGCNVSNCAEISLKASGGFCNLTTLNAGEVTCQEDLNQFSKCASFIGTLQASYTDFHYLNNQWKENADKEALIGVSITGIASGNLDNLDLKEAANIVKQENARVAKLIGINKAARCTTVKPEGCLKADTLISTNKGILYLDEIGDITGDTWQSVNITVATDSLKESVDKFYINGVSKTKKILLNSGIELESTENHKFRILTESGDYIWKTAKELKTGDILPYSLGDYDGKEYQALTKLNYEKSRFATRTKNIIQPNILTEELAWFLGFYFGNGSNHTKGIRLYGNYSEQKGFEKLQQLSLEIFGIEAKVFQHSAKDNRGGLYVTSIELLKFLSANNLLKQKSYEIEIPQLIRCSPKSVIESFIEGYGVADGCDKNLSSFSYCTTSKKWAEQLTVCLRAIGRDCKMRLMPPTESSFGNRMRYWISERKGRAGADYNGKKKYYDFLDNLGLTSFSIDKIIELSDSEAITYDLEVPTTHTYLANSYISHNTASILLGTSSGIHAWHNDYYLRRVRVGKEEAVYRYLKKIVPDLLEDEFFKPNLQSILSIPIKAPEGAKLRTETALEFLARVKKYNTEWIREGHRKGNNYNNVSCTVSIRDTEVEQVREWLWENREVYNGITIVPYDNKNYVQAPFEDIIKEQYEELSGKLNLIDFSKIIEEDDQTVLQEAIACGGGACEIR